MATINSKAMIHQIIEANGYFMDDPRVIKIIEYTNIFGGTCYGVVWENEKRLGKAYIDRYDKETEFIHNPMVIWDKTDE